MRQHHPHRSFPNLGGISICFVHTPISRVGVSGKPGAVHYEFYECLTKFDSEHLRTFLTVSRHCNVARAAQALNRTQSAVSIQIKRLEENLAVTLFRQGPRGVTLTEAGDRLRQAAEPIVNDLDQTLRIFRADPIGGLVRVGIPDEYGSDVLPTILADFVARFPAVEAFVQYGFSANFPAAVERGAT